MTTPSDFVKDVAIWYPLRVIMSILGVPEEDEALMLKLTQEMRFSIEQVDALTGPVMGRPKSATYRTADLMLSSAQDYRKGSRGNQSHAWQATFDANAQVFQVRDGVLADADASAAASPTARVVASRIPRCRS